MPIKASNQITISNVLDGQNAIAVILSNENHTFSANSSGQATATTISTSISAYAGTTKIATTVGSIAGLPTGMSMTVNNNGKTDTTISITVTTSLTTMSGSVNIPITANGTTITKTFSYTLSKTGATGSAGQNATAYWLVTSTAAISKSITGVYNPSSIILTGKYKTGNSAVANYSGRFQIFLNGSTTATYTSSANEVTKSYTIPANTTSIRCVMYASGGTSTILDEQTIPVVSDGQTGTNGRGVSSIVEYYLASSSSSGVTTSTAGWATTIPTITATNKYLWNYEVIQYTDNTSSEPTTPKIIGAYGNTGNAGKGIKSTAITYQASSSGTTTPTGTWATTIPSVSANQFLWTRTVITYTDNTTSTSYSIGKMGATGATGNTGKGIASTAITYQASTSGTTVPTGTWSTSIPSVTANQFLWTRTVITYTDNTASTSYAIGKMGATGATGATGNGISGITNYYLATASASGVTTSTSGWTTTVQTLTATNKYLWNYEVVTYTNGNSYTSTPVIIGAYGDKGQTGATGATGTGYTIVLTNENHTFPASATAAIAGSASTNIVLYKNTTQIASTISKIGTTNVSGNQTGVATGVTGLTANVTNNGTTTATITFNATTALTTRSGTVAVTITADGKTFVKNFSFSLAMTGATGGTGAAAKSVDITATSQVFKSTDGGLTFSPDNIKLTPVFQGGIAFSKWQYSTNGGTSWTDVASGSNGLTVASGVLTIAKTCNLFTDSITALSFKCISNNASYYDVMTVLKLYDVTDIEIGGRNLAEKTNQGILNWIWSMQVGDYTKTEVIENGIRCCKLLRSSTAQSGWSVISYSDIGRKKLEADKQYTISFEVYPSVSTSFSLGLQESNGSNQLISQTVFSQRTANANQWNKCYYVIYLKSQLPESVAQIMYLTSMNSSPNVSYMFKNLKIEKGNKPTDWTPAPEDVQNDINEINFKNDLIVGTQTAVTGTWLGNAAFSHLKDGQQITYWLPYNGSGNASLNLTLANGTTTGAVPCYYSGTSRLTTHYSAGNAIRLTYRKNVTIGSTTITHGWWGDANYNSDTTDRIRFSNNITAKTAITASRLICGDATGYFHLIEGSVFDTDKPILYASSAIAVNGVGTNNYLAFPTISLRNNLSSTTIVAKETCYLVGTLSGSKFTVKSPVFTTTKPTLDDGLVYISLGLAVSTYQIYLYPEHPMYRFVNDGFKSFAQIAYEAEIKAQTVQTELSTVKISVDKANGQITQLIQDTTITKLVEDENGESVETVVSLKDAFNETVDTVNSHTTTIAQNETKLNETNMGLVTVSNKQVQIRADLDGLTNTVTDTQDGITKLTKEVQDANGWKYIAAVTGQYDPTDPNSVKQPPTSKLQKVVTIDLRGITIEDEEADIGAKTILDSDGLVGYIKRGSNVDDERIFQIDGNRVYTNRLYVDNGMDLITIKGLPRYYENGHESFEFIKGGGTS